MKHLVRISLLLLSCAAGAIAIAEESVPMCTEGQLYLGVGGDGWTTTVAPYLPGIATGEQIGEFNLFLLGEHPAPCPGIGKRHGHSSQLMHWHGVVRGQMADAGLRHALVNLEGPGFMMTSDFAVPAGTCMLDGEEGVLLQEELTIVTGTWDDWVIAQGTIQAAVCLPGLPHEIGEGARVEFEILEGTYLCLTPDTLEP
jgi:hypothetical protein